MGPGQSRLLIWTVPTIAILLSLLWYKRKSGKRGEPGGINPTIPEFTSKSETETETEAKAEPEATKQVIEKCATSPIRSPYCRSLSGIDSAPIDIKSNRSPPLIISDTELDMEIEKIKSMKSASNHMHSLSSSSSETMQSTQIAEPIRSEEGTRDSANHSPAEAMLASPSCSIGSDGHHSDSDSGKGGSDVATPPPPSSQPQTLPPQSYILIHEFIMPQQLVGRLIGRHGAFVHQIKDKTNAHILIKRHPETVKNVKVCAVEGTRVEIDAALDMIREKFPEKRYPEVTLEHVTFADSTHSVSLVPDCMHLKLVESINNDTIVSCMVTPRHLFLQQPTHPTFPSLNILSAYMNACYAEESTESPPLLPTPVQDNTICAALSLGAWYRAMVVSSDDEAATCCVRFLDYGGYATVETNALRQIRGDFLLLPFQAAECLLASVQPPAVAEDSVELWPQEAYDMVADLTKGQVVFTQIVDYMDDLTPLVHIYVRGPEHVVFLNKELVSRGLAIWQDVLS